MTLKVVPQSPCQEQSSPGRRPRSDCGIEALEDREKVEVRIDKELSAEEYRALLARFEGFSRIRELRVLFRDHRFTEAKARAIMACLEKVTSLESILLQNSHARLRDGTAFEKLKLAHPTAQMHLMGAQWFK